MRLPTSSRSLSSAAIVLCLAGCEADAVNVATIVDLGGGVMDAASPGPDERAITGGDLSRPCLPNLPGPPARSRFSIHEHPVDSPVLGIEAFDVDADGDLDVLGSAHGLAVLRNDGRGAFTLLPKKIGSLVNFEIQVLDLDGDGRLDVAGLNFAHTTSRAVFYRNRVGVGLVEDSLELAGGIWFKFNIDKVSFGDLNGDRIADIVAGSSAHEPSEWYLSGRNGPYSVYREHWAFATPPAQVVDLDGDRLADLVMGCLIPGTFIAFNRPGLDWGDVQSGDLNKCLGSLYVDLPLVADADGDGRPDIWGLDLPSLTLLRQVAPRTFLGESLCVNFRAGYFTIGDLDGNGLPDAILGGRLGGQLLIVLNPGRDRPVVTRMVDLGGKSAGPLVARDFDGDGRVDVAVAKFVTAPYSGNASIVILRNLGGW